MNFNLISMRPSYMPLSFELRVTRKISLAAFANRAVIKMTNNIVDTSDDKSDKCIITHFMRARIAK